MTRINIFRHAETVALEPGHVIFKAGDPGDNMYAIVEGTVDIKLGEVLLETFGEGAIFGEMALIDRSPRSATAIVATPAKVVAVDERSFLRLVQQNPFFALEVMTEMANRLRHTNARVTVAAGVLPS